MFTLKRHVTMKKTATTYQSDEDLKNLGYKVTVYQLAESAMVHNFWLPPNSKHSDEILCLVLFCAVCLCATLQHPPQPQPGPAGFCHSQGVRAAGSPLEGPVQAAGTLLDGACVSAAYKAPATKQNWRPQNTSIMSNQAESNGTIRTVNVSSLPPTSSNVRDGYCSSGDFDFAETQFAITVNSWSEMGWRLNLSSSK